MVLALYSSGAALLAAAFTAPSDTYLFALAAGAALVLLGIATEVADVTREAGHGNH